MITVIDTETSGLGINDTILQLAYHRYADDGTLSNTFSAYINPPFDFEINEKAAEVNGLTKAFLLENGYIRSQTVSMLTRICRFASEGDLFVAHNATFDIRMIRQTCRQYEIEELPELQYFCTKENKAIRELVGATDKNNRLKSPSLAELHNYLFGKHIEGAHDALNDVRSTARCYFELKKRGIV